MAVHSGMLLMRFCLKVIVITYVQKKNEITSFPFLSSLLMKTLEDRCFL